MLFSQEVLKSTNIKVSFYNLDETIEITDIRHIQNKPEEKFKKQYLYWLDLNDISSEFIRKSNGILLLSKKQFQKLRKNDISGVSLIVASDTSTLFFSIAEFLYNYEIYPGIHPTATVDPDANVGQNVYIGPGAVIDLCSIGDNCVIHSNCSIGKGVKIGNNSIIHSGANIGFNVFSFKQNPTGNWKKYQQIAGVRIEDNVTIGSNTCINNGFLTDTVIHNNSFIDSLCQIQGSVVIGSNSIIAAKSFIATNVTIGKRCWISPNVSIRENIYIADDVFIGIGSVVLRSINESCRVFGVPAKRIDFN